MDEEGGVTARRATRSSFNVYVLRSCTTNRTYVGATTNMARRIRQHNGEISGGARATSAGRPWRCVALVRNLPSWSEALKLEWRLKRRRGGAPRSRCQALRCALGMERWTRSATPTATLRCSLEVLWRAGDDDAETAAAQLRTELPQVAQRIVVHPEKHEIDLASRESDDQRGAERGHDPMEMKMQMQMQTQISTLDARDGDDAWQRGENTQGESDDAAHENQENPKTTNMQSATITSPENMEAVDPLRPDGDVGRTGASGAKDGAKTHADQEGGRRKKSERTDEIGKKCAKCDRVDGEPDMGNPDEDDDIWSSKK